MFYLKRNMHEQRKADSNTSFVLITVYTPLGPIFGGEGFDPTIKTLESKNRLRGKCLVSKDRLITVQFTAKL